MYFLDTFESHPPLPKSEGEDRKNGHTISLHFDPLPPVPITGGRGTLAFRAREEREGFMSQNTAHRLHLRRYSSLSPGNSVLPVPRYDHIKLFLDEYRIPPSPS